MQNLPAAALKELEKILLIRLEEKSKICRIYLLFPAGFDGVVKRPIFSKLFALECELNFGCETHHLIVSSENLSLLCRYADIVIGSGSPEISKLYFQIMINEMRERIDYMKHAPAARVQ